MGTESLQYQKKKKIKRRSMRNGEVKLCEVFCLDPFFMWHDFHFS